MLVVLATDRACQSPAVEREIRQFLPTGRIIVPVDLCGNIMSARWWPLLEGLPISAESQVSPDAQVSIVSGAGEQPQTLRPSTAIVDRVESCINFTKRDTRLRLTAAGMMGLLAVILGAALLATSALKSTQNKLVVTKQETQKAVVQKQNAETQQKRAELLSKARTTLDYQDPLAALEPIRESLKLADGSDARLLSAEAYNDGIPTVLPLPCRGLRQFQVDPLHPRLVLAIGVTNGQAAGKDVLALMDLKTGSVKMADNAFFLSACFSPDASCLYAIGVTKNQRGPENAMDTKIDWEVSLLKYDLSLTLLQKKPLPSIETHGDAPDSRPTEWDVRDIQDLQFSASGNRLVLAGYASKQFMRNVGNAFPFHLRGWISAATGDAHLNVDAEHELSSDIEYRGRVLMLDESHVVVDGTDEVYVVDLDSGTRSLIGRHTSDVGDLAVSPDHTAVAAVGDDNRLSLFRRVGTNWQSKVVTLDGDASGDRVVFFDERNLAVARGNGSLSLLWLDPAFDDESLHLEGQLVWRVPRQKTLAGHSARISVLTVSTDGRWLATGAEDNTVRLWSPYEYRSRVLCGSKRGIRDVRFSADSKQIFSSDSDGILRVFPVEDEHNFTLAVAPDSKRYEAMVSDSLWDEGGGLMQWIIREHLGFVRDFVRLNNGHLVAHGYDDRRTEWDTNYAVIGSVMKLARTKADHEDPSEEALAATRDADERAGRDLNSSNEWAEMTSNKSLYLRPLPFPGPPGKTNFAGVFSPDDAMFFRFDFQKQCLDIWKVNSPDKPMASLEVVYGRFHSDNYGTPDVAKHVRFSRTGNYVAFPMYFDGEAICVVNLRTFQVRLFSADLVEAAFDISDNGILVAAGRTGEVYVHDVAKDSTFALEKHGRYVSSVAINANGRWIASGSRDRSVRLWAGDSGQYCEFKLQNPVEQVQFSPSGKELLAASGGAIHSWYVPTDLPLVASAQKALVPAKTFEPGQAVSGAQADNLAILVHGPAGVDRCTLIQEALGRKVELTDTHKENLLALLDSEETPVHTRVRAALELTCFGTNLVGDASRVVQALRSPSPETDPVVQNVGDLLRHLGGSVEGILHTEGNTATNPVVRNNILYAEGTLFPESSIVRQDLLDHLRDPDEATRITSAMLLSANRKDESAIPILVAAIASGNPRRGDAAEALKRYGESAVPVLIPLFGSTNRFFYENPKDQTREILVVIGSPAVPPLIVALKTMDGDALRDVIRTLGEMGTAAHEARDPLIELWKKHSDWTEILDTLADIGPDDPRVLEVLLDVLTDSKRQLDAAFAFRSMFAATAVPALRNALHGPNPESVRYVAEALGEMGTNATEAIPDLIVYLQAGISNRAATDAEVEICSTLGKMGPSASNAVPVLLEYLPLCIKYQRSSVLEALGQIKPAATDVVPALLAFVRTEAPRSDFQRFRINRQTLDRLSEAGVPDQVVRRLERLDDGIGRQEELFSSLAAREVGAEYWATYRDQILRSAQDPAASECDEDGVVRAAFNVIGGCGEQARPFLPQILDLRALFSQCADVSRYITEVLDRISPVKVASKQDRL
jgi:WD40 repeat protein/HEAT repeat protein